jgi:lysozyme
VVEIPDINVSTTNVRFDDVDRFEWQSTRPWQYPIHGVDVSKFQGDIDWSTAGRSGVNFAFIKATEGGDHLDQRFQENWHNARRAGVLRGAYHFYYFCRTPIEQANWFIRNVPREANALPPVLDMEWNHLSRTCRRFPDAITVRREMRVFLDRITQHYGKRPIIYSTPRFYEENELWKVRGASFWLRTVAGHPSEKYPGRSWNFWQYTSTGRIPGIEGDVDINAFSGTVTDWKYWVYYNTR